MDLEGVFEKAAEYAKNHIGCFQTEQVLLLYGLFKQATVGTNTTPKPKFWNVTAKQKWDAWTQQANKDPHTAMEEYINLVTAVNPTWLSEKNQSWVVHSTHRNENTTVPESEQDVFYWVKENDQPQLQKAVNNMDLTVKDEEGLSLLHWAADRGHAGIIRTLLSAGVDPNVQDPEGQTPLHYAAACGHEDALTALLEGNASLHIADDEGNTPKDIATPEITQIINSTN